jgi:hypothetical protein
MCLESHAIIWTGVYHQNNRICRIGENFLRIQQAHTRMRQYANNASLRLDGRDLLAPCASIPPYRWTCLEVECEGKERPAEPESRMDVPDA